ncbi:MAG TPA: hypothetical protein VG498_17025 [Terriglobales bacterium]|nr:hypothetical protein [Terriglobales bacterium]
MTVSKLSECRLYSSAVIKPAAAFPVFRLDSTRVPGQEEAGIFQRWILPLLTLLGTIAAMWFVVGDGWFQLFGFWGS